MDSERCVYNILLVGETGVGKSTFINAFMNYINFPTLPDALHADTVHALIPSKFTITDSDFNTRLITFGEDTNESFDPGASSTQYCRSYKFTTGDVAVRLIDSPGVGDTRGIRKDDDNFLHLLRYLGEFEYVNAIVILLKPNDSRVTVLFEYCVKQLLASLERSAVENIVFLFTNARGTFYSPGDTVTPLRAILKDIAERPPNVAVPFNKRNTFCVDNEAFRFLLAKREGYVFDEKAQMSFIESWNISADICQNLLKYVKSLKPHQIQNTVSLMEARRTIERLRVPLAEIAQLIKDNIQRITRLEEKLSDNTKRLEDLQPYLYVSRINLTVNKLDHPMTVCGETSCTDAHKIEDSTNIHYKTICHERCALNDVPREVRGDPGLQRCLAMTSKKGAMVCKECGHSYLQHLHIYYTTTPYNETRKDEKIDTDINKKKLEQADIEKALQEYRVEKKKYEAEQEVIQKAVAKFAHFLKNSAILAYNDVYKKYIEYLIEREKNLGEHARPHAIRDFERMIEAYEQEKKTLDEALAKAQHEDGTVKTVVTAEEVVAIIKLLYDLPLTGKTIREMYEAQETHVATETVKSTEKVVEATGFAKFRKWIHL